MSPFADAALIVTRAALLLERAGGLTVLERHLHTAARAGLKRVWIGAPRPAAEAIGALRLPAGLEVFWNEKGGAPACRPPYLVLSADHFIRVETLRHAVESSYPAPAALEDAAGATVVSAVPFASETALVQRRQALPEGSSVRLEPPFDEGPVMAWLLALGGKSQDGFMARNFDRHISLAVSRLLLDTRATPNHMTIVSVLIGLTGAACFLVPEHSWRLAGALLVWLHSVLDGCDGELARIRFEESPFGADVDFWGDNLVHLALFLCLGIGFARGGGGLLALALGAAAAAGALGSAVLSYRKRLARRRAPAAPEQDPAGLNPNLVRLEEALEARDFIYLLVFLAAINRTYEFLWASAVGSLLFFAMTTHLGRVRHEQESSPRQPRSTPSRA